MDAVHVGVEIADPDWAARLDAHLGPLPGELEAAEVAYVLLGADRADTPGPSPSPTLLGAMLARRTHRTGLVVATSPQRDHPYNAARRIATLDHVSAGRAAGLFLRHDQALDLGVAPGSAWASGQLGAAELADAAAAARALWRTWPVETLTSGPEAYDHPIRYADHVGVFSSKGPLNVPTTPQGEPLVFWLLDAREPVADATVAATVADVVLVDAVALAALDHVGRVALSHVLAGTTQLHVRLAVPLDQVATELTRLADDGLVSGVTLAVAADDLARLGAEVLPALREAGVVAPTSSGTLRDRLGAPRRTEPDLSSNELAFPPLATKEPA